MRSLIKKDPVSMLIWGNKTEIKRYKQFTLNGYAKNILQGNPLRQENLKGTAWFCFLFRPMDIWTVEIPYYLNQGGIIVFNFKMTTWRSQTPYIPDYFFGFQTSAEQSSVETKEAQVSLNSLHCLFLCCLKSPPCKDR